MKTAQNTELLPCPFCGGKAELRRTSKTGLTIMCTNCSVARKQKALGVSLEWLEDKMIQRWNTRVKRL